MANSITYNDKSTLNAQPGLADVNKITSGDMNEIKTIVNGCVTVVNNIVSRLGILEDATNWGTFTGTTIADNVSQLKTIIQTLETAIESAGGALSDGSVTTAKLADLAVTTVKIANLAVTLGKIAAINDGTILGNDSGGSASPQALAPTEVKALLNIVPADITGFDNQVSLNTDVNGNSIDVANLQTATGAADGVAHLGTFSDSILADNQTLKTLLQALSTAIQLRLHYQGAWNASTNSPALSTGTGTPGHLYRVGTAGTTDLEGETDWQIGDFLFADDSGTWVKMNLFSSTKVQSVIDSQKRDPILLPGTANSSYSLSIAQVDAIISEMTGATYDGTTGKATLSGANVQKGMVHFADDWKYEVITAGKIVARTARKDTTGGGGDSASISNPLIGGALQDLSDSTATPTQLLGPSLNIVNATGSQLRLNTGDFHDSLTFAGASLVNGDFTFTVRIFAAYTGSNTNCNFGLGWRAGIDPAGSNLAESFIVTWQNQTIAMNGQDTNTNHRVRVHYRDPGSDFTDQTNGATNIQLPVYLRIVRSGDNFLGQYSTDGVSFTTIKDSTTDMNGTSSIGFIGLVGLSNDETNNVRFDTDLVTLE